MLSDTKRKMKEKLKVGVFLNNFLIPAWEYKILEEIIHSDFARITLLVKNDLNVSFAIKRKRTLGFIILKLHERIDRLIFKNSSDYSLRKDSSDLLKEVSEIVIDPIEKDFIVRFSEEDIAEIKKHSLDIIVNFGFSKLKGDILKTPKYGIWSYHMGDASIDNTVISGYWEVVRSCPITYSVLEILKEDSKNGTIIYCSRESTYVYSINVNRNRLFWRASLFIPRIMNGLFKYGDSYFDKMVNRFKKDIPSTDNKLFKAPEPLPAAVNFFNYFANATKKVFRRLFYTAPFNWILLFKINNCSGNSYSTSFKSFKKLASSKEKFWADPFVINRDNKYYIFVEEFIYRTNKGHISVIELDNSGNFLSSEKIIERPYHMSYPFVFEINDSYYMIPETSQNRTIELYKCKNFPYKWEFTKNLMRNIFAVDSTLFFYNNKWWFFTSIDETNNISGCSSELFLFFSDDLFSDKWESHPCNPIISDIRTARPAGKLFIQDNKIYRPSQDCSGRYGKGFNLNQITILTETEYEEILVSKVEPSWDNKLKGTHTFNFDKNITIIDAYSYRRRI